MSEMSPTEISTVNIEHQIFMFVSQTVPCHTVLYSLFNEMTEKLFFAIIYMKVRVERLQKLFRSCSCFDNTGKGRK